VNFHGSGRGRERQGACSLAKRKREELVLNNITARFPLFNVNNAAFVKNKNHNRINMKFC
jgi:hypothetical protein